MGIKHLTCSANARLIEILSEHSKTTQEASEFTQLIILSRLPVSDGISHPPRLYKNQLTVLKQLTNKQADILFLNYLTKKVPLQVNVTMF